MPSGSSFEADLRAHREAAGLTLDEIQRETRIPVDVLQRFEDGELAGDPAFNEIYLKALLRSYAQAVGLPVSRVVEAFGAHKSGTYSGELSPSHEAAENGGRTMETAATPDETPADSSSDELTPVETSSTEPSEEGDREIDTEGSEVGVGSSIKTEASSEKASPVDAVPEETSTVTEPRESASSRPAPAVKTAHTFPGRHSTSGRRTSASPTTNWGPILGVLAVLVLVLAGAIWFFFLREPSPDPVAENSAVTTDTVQQDDVVEEAPAPRLERPIRVTVSASGDGLQDFRVTEAPNERRPYWVEPGDSLTFESDSLVVIWGENAEGLSEEAAITLQGFTWTVPGGVLRIDAARGQRLLDSLHATRTDSR